MLRVAINGYGNLGRGVEQAITKNADMEVAVVFTRRDPATVTTQGAPVAHVDDMAAWADKVDVCLNCGGSATDLIEQTPAAATLFNTVDSFDTHARIPEHFAAVDAAAKASGHVALISAGWDPGLFSMLRVLGEAVLPDGATTTFWGPGVSQGHSDALRRIEGVLDAKQYTRPVEATVAAVKAGDDVELTTRSMHTRDCYVVAEEGADRARIEREIVEMPNYFADYDTTVTFITAEELAAEGVRDALVLGCDSVFEFEGRAYGKPHTAENARERITAMSGHHGTLHTGHALVDLREFDPEKHAEAPAVAELRSAVVHFDELSPAEVEAYIATGEPLWVAGSFTLDGYGSAFIRGIEGEFHTVVGLSIHALRELLRRRGVAVTDLWLPPED